MLSALRRHWPEYLIEAAGLGFFMISAAVFATLLEHPLSPVHGAIPNPWLRRVCMGAAMGLTAIAIVYSPWGQQSGAHVNPSLTLVFARLGKVAPWDAVFYACAQFAGGLAGITVAAAVLGSHLGHPTIRYVATVPGVAGPGVAFVAEVAISFGLMTVVLFATNTPRLAPFTGIFAGALVATYITFEAPLSGMSMNPARSFASAVPASLWGTLWLYFTAPPVGMLAAAEVYLRLGRARPVFCAKLHHQNRRRCIFRCGYRRT
jgi:aquaporin Z